MWSADGSSANITARPPNPFPPIKKSITRCYGFFFAPYQHPVNNTTFKLTVHYITLSTTYPQYMWKNMWQKVAKSGYKWLHNSKKHHNFELLKNYKK